MQVPSYLYRSKHAVFYFRWPISRGLHPQKKASTIKVSLRTREPRVALELGRYLCYLSSVAITHPVSQPMQYQEMRAFLQRIYANALSVKKQRILSTGRLSAEERAQWKNMSEWADHAIADGDPFSLVGSEDVERLITTHALPITKGSVEFDTFGVERQRAIRDMASAVLDFDASLERFDLDRPTQPPATATTVPADTQSDLRLSGLIDRYKLERERDPVAEQLQVSDVKQIEGIWCFDVTDVGENEDGEATVKQLKSEAAKRVVPVHPELIALGLLDYVARLREQDATRLFPTFKLDVNNGWGRQLGRWANDTFLVRLGYKTKRIVFHSFRHTLITRLSQAGVQEPIVKALVGHEQQGVTQKSYLGEGYKIQQLYDAISLMEPSVSRSS